VRTKKDNKINIFDWAITKRAKGKKWKILNILR